jgi:hypothetical protein
MIGVQGFDSWQGLRIFLFTIMSRMAAGPTQPPIQWVPGALSLGVKRPGHEADHSPPSSAEVKNAWGYTSTPPICLHGVVPSQSPGTILPLHCLKLKERSCYRHKVWLYCATENENFYLREIGSHKLHSSLLLNLFLQIIRFIFALTVQSSDTKTV